MTEAKLAEFFLPLGPFRDPLDTLAQAGGADPKAVDGCGVGFHELFEPQIDGVDGEFFGDFVELYLQGEAWLRCAMKWFLLRNL